MGRGGFEPTIGDPHHKLGVITATVGEIIFVIFVCRLHTGQCCPLRIVLL